MNMQNNMTGAKPVVSARAKERLEAAENLCHAIAQCDPRDACHIMLAALTDLSVGHPRGPLFNYADEANWWADMACEAELKSYLLACWTRLPPSDQAAFIAFTEKADT